MKPFYLILFAVCPFIILAQNLKTGPVYEDAFYDYAPQILGAKDSLLFAADIDRNQIVIESYRKDDLSRKYHKVIETNASIQYPRVVLIKDLFYTNGYFVYFTAMTNFRFAVSELYMHRINALTGEEEPKETIIAQMLDLSDYQLGMPLENWLGEYFISYSENGNRTAVVFSFINNANRKVYEYIMLFDENMQRIKEKEIIRESLAETIPPGILVDKEGNLYFLRGNDIVLLDYFNDYEEWAEPLSMEGVASNGQLQIGAVKFRNNGNLVLAVEHLTTDIEDTDENKERENRKAGDTQIEGMGYMEINTLYQELKHSKLLPLDSSLLEELQTFEHKEKGWEAEMNDEYTYEWKFLPEQTILIGEAGFDGTAFQDYFNQLVVFCYSKEGDLQWTKVIHKKQQSKEAYTSSYASFFDSEYLYLLYNDDPDNYLNNIPKAEIDKWKEKSDNVPVLARLDLKTGEGMVKSRPDIRVEDFAFQPVFARQVDAGEPLYIFMKDGRDYRLAQINTKP